MRLIKKIDIYVFQGFLICMKLLYSSYSGFAWVRESHRIAWEFGNCEKVSEIWKDW